jgi:RNA polymerase sigma-70 factor (sigma-E family)
MSLLDPAAPAAEQSAATLAVTALYRAHRMDLVRLAVFLTDDRGLAEDLVQDAFAALHRRWGSIAEPAAAVGYLRTSVVNGSRSVLRRRRTARAYTWPDIDRQPGDGADAGVLVTEEHREVLRALRTLPSRQREVIVLRYWADLPEAQISAMLGISVGAVKSSASRGRDALAAILGGAR